MKRLLVCAVVVLILLAALLGGCGQQTESQQGQSGQKDAVREGGLLPIDPPVKVTVGAKQVVSDAGVLIGMAKGYYRS